MPAKKIRLLTMSIRPMSQQVTTIGVNNTANDDCNKLSWKQKQKTSKEIIVFTKAHAI